MCHIHPPASGDVLAERLFTGTIHALELFSIYLGRKLGLYEALATQGPLTAKELAEACGIDARYAREWLEQQAVAGFLAADAQAEGPESRQFRLPRQHARVLHEAEDPAHVAPLAEMLGGVAAVLPRVVEAYRTGGGVPYRAFGEDFRTGQGGVNRPAFLKDLPRAWLPSIPDIDARLQRRGTRVADVGCGQGWAAFGVAEAYPLAEVTGFDLDEASIHDARRLAAERGSRARFEVRDAGGLKGAGPFDVILVLEALHDMSRPVEALRGMAEALAPDGAILIADERVAHRFEAPGNEIERIMYGWSVVHCLPASKAEIPSAALGTALRPSTVEALASEAGLDQFEILPIENPLFRFYRLSRRS